MDAASSAAAEVARRRVKRAGGLLREAVRDLAALADGPTAVGVTRVHDQATAEAARELIALGVGRHGAVDVVVLARPTHPHQGPEGAKEADDGTQTSTEGAGRNGRRPAR